MPAYYAHYRFGKQLLASMPADVRQCIQRFRRMYDMGLCGPDIFDFYNPLMKTALGELGETFHNQSGQEFFTRACAVATSEAACAYLYGLLAHYCLDAACRPVIRKKETDGEGERTCLEAEFDRYLMELDGLPQPHTQDFSRRMKLTRGECMTVAEFYPPATGANVSHCVHVMAGFSRFAANKNRKGRETLLEKLAPGLRGRMIPQESNEALARLDSELLVRFNRSLKQYPECLRQLLAHKKTGEPLGGDFLSTFGC